MSLFRFDFNLINKQSDAGKNCLLEKSGALTKSRCFGTFSKTAEEVNDEASQFFIQEKDLWNEDDKDVFEPLKPSKRKKNSPEAKDKPEDPPTESTSNKKEHTDDSVDQSEVTGYKETTKSSPAEEDEVEEEKLDLDLKEYCLQNSDENEISFNLVDEIDEDIVLQDSSDTIPASPTFHVSCKPAKKAVECKKDVSNDRYFSEVGGSRRDDSDKHCNFKLSNSKDDSDNRPDFKFGDSVDDSDTRCNFEVGDSKKDSDNRCNFEVCDSSLEKSVEKEKNSLCVSKDKLNPLGLSEKTDQWLTTLLQHEAFSNVSCDTPGEKLQNNLTFLNKAYVELLEKAMSAFENLPVDLLSQFPEFDPKVFITLRTTRRRIKAVVIKTENLLKRRNLDARNAEKSWDCWESESDVSRQRPDLVGSFEDFGNKSFGFKQVFSSAAESKTKSDFSSPPVSGRKTLVGKQGKLNFPVLSSSKADASELDVEVLHTSTPLSDHGARRAGTNPKAGMMDYTDVMFKTMEQNHPRLHNARNDSTTGEFDGMNFPHSEEIAKTFRQKFGLKTFRPNQLQVINAALLGHDCFVLMPTGGGKSLCYQLPALVSSGVTVVISPLRSLILDQVTKLLTLDIAAAYLSGDVKESEATSVYRKLNQPEPKIKLLYVTPEKVIANTTLRNCLLGLYKRQMLARFVIDEAHCVSQWGHDFRPDYKKLRELRENFPDVRIMALTATATPRVRTDILYQLKVANPKWFLSSFNRSNLAYSVRDKKGKSTVKEIATLILTEFKKDSGVVYCLSRNESEEVAKKLSEHGILAVAYHAGLKDEERSRVQSMWMNDKARVVCATIAFGMGIDKLDVRFVIHYSLPQSIEGYYQESGRAGRDGEKATCILFYSYRDKLRLVKLINADKSVGTREIRKVHMDNLYRVVSFAENKTDCRRALQLEYFGEKFDRKLCMENRNTACDNCLGRGIYETIDATAESQAIVASVRDVCGTGEKGNSNFTMLHFVEVFRGTVLKKVISVGHDKLPMYGMGKSWLRTDVERLFRKLIMEEFLKERLFIRDEVITLAYISFGRRGEELLKGNVTITFEVRKRKGSSAAQTVTVRPENRIDPAVLEIQEKCYGELMDAIHEIASSVNCNPNAIMNVQALRAMSSSLPETEEEMLSINHVTTANFEKYGNVLLEITKKFAEQKKAVQIEEIPEDVFLRKFLTAKNPEDSPYFEGDIEYVGKGRGGGKRKRPTRRTQGSKRWKGTERNGKDWRGRDGQASSKYGGGRGKSKREGVRDDGSGVTTVAGAKFSTLMELPTDKSRGFARPRVLLKNL